MILDEAGLTKERKKIWLNYFLILDHSIKSRSFFVFCSFGFFFDVFSFKVSGCCFGNFDISFEGSIINCVLCID